MTSGLLTRFFLLALVIVGVSACASVPPKADHAGPVALEAGRFTEGLVWRLDHPDYAPS